MFSLSKLKRTRRLALLGVCGFVALVSTNSLSGYGQVSASLTSKIGSLQPGTVKISLESPGTISTDISRLLPGRSTEKVLTVRNISTLEVSSIVASLDVTGSGASLITSANGVQLKLDRCTSAWTAVSVSSAASNTPVTGWSCLGTTDTDSDGRGDGTSVFGLSSPQFSNRTIATDLGRELPTTDPESNDIYLRATFVWPDGVTVTAADLPTNANLAWTFTAQQRTGRDR